MATWINDRCRLTPVEIKAGRSLDLSFADNIRKFMSYAPDCAQPAILYAGDTTATAKDIQFDNFKNTYRLFENPSAEQP